MGMASTFQPIQPPGQKLPFNSGAIYAVHASIYHNPGRQGLQAFMQGAGMKPPKWVSVWLRFYPNGEIPWLLKFFKDLDELISPQLVPGRRSLIFPAQLIMALTPH